MTKERIQEIKQMQDELFRIVKKIGYLDIKNNSIELNQLMIFFSMAQTNIKELIQALEGYVHE